MKTVSVSGKMVCEQRVTIKMQNGLSKKNCAFHLLRETLDTLERYLDGLKKVHAEGRKRGALPFMRKYRSFGTILL